MKPNHGQTKKMLVLNVPVAWRTYAMVTKTEKIPKKKTARGEQPFYNPLSCKRILKAQRKTTIGAFGANIN